MTGAPKQLLTLAGIAGQAALAADLPPTTCPPTERNDVARRRAWMEGYVRELVTREAQFLAALPPIHVKQDAAPRFWTATELLFLELAYRPPGRPWRAINGRVLAQLLERDRGTVRVRACRAGWSHPKSKPARAA